MNFKKCVKTCNCHHNWFFSFFKSKSLNKILSKHVNTSYNSVELLLVQDLVTFFFLKRIMLFIKTF